jgi:superfamily II DNA or RNA helicase
MDLASEARQEFVPCLRLFTEPVLVEDLEADPPGFAERELPVLSLTFDYGGVRVRAQDRRDRFFVSQRGGVAHVARDQAGEARIQRMLEGFGAVELGCVDHIVASEDSTADYAVQAHGDVHSWCWFTAQALPKLEELGFRVEVTEGYPYRNVSGDARWFADVRELDDARDWFSLELGVEIEGQRVDLLPALLELIDERQKGGSLRALLDRPGRVRAVRAGDERYVLVPPERLKRLLRVLLELYGELPQCAPREFRGVQAAALGKLDRALEGSVDWHGSSHVRDRGRALIAPPEPTPVPPALGLLATLRPYQEQGVAWLQNLAHHRAGGVLADDMGLGKTLQTIAHLCAEHQSGRGAGKPSLIVAPTSLIGNWERELARFAPGLKVAVMHGARRRTAEVAHSDVVLTSYGLMARDADALRRHVYHALILDEAQAIKNHRCQASRAARSLMATQRLCLSGTPVENNLEELWSLFDFLMPGFLGTVEQFRTAFRHPIEREANAARLEMLRERVAPFILRRMKHEVLSDLPSKTALVRWVELGGAQRELYESIRVAAHSDVRRAIRTKGFSRSAIAILDALMKLRQVCCDPRLVRVEAARAVEESAKYQFFLQLLSQELAQKRRVLVFSQFAQMLELLSMGLRERQIRHVMLTGSTADRRAPVDAFQNGDAEVFLISLKAGGTGLNLTRAETVIHYDPWWNPAAQAQATDRAHRIGQTRPVFVYGLIAAGSVEERMLVLQRKKQQIADTLLGNGQGGGAPLSLDDVEDLLGPLPEV